MSKDSLLRHSRRMTQQLLDIFFPPACAGCKKGGCVLCPSCLATFTANDAAYVCKHCGTPLPVTGLCVRCHTHYTHHVHQPILSGLQAVGSYQGPLRSCIHALKYDGNTRLAEPLGAILAQIYRRHGMLADVIIPVPLHSERQQQRGYNHAHLLAEACAAQLHLPLCLDMIVRQRATPAQVGLNAQERQQNVAGAFECTPPFSTGRLHGRIVLIIDDVYTTGATLEACARPLFAAGAKAVWGLVLARPA